MMGSIRSKLGLFFFLLSIFLLFYSCKQVLVSNSAGQRHVDLDPGGACTNGDEIEITVSGSGTVVVTAHAMFGLKSHTQGLNDLGMLFIDDHARECDYDCHFHGCPMGFSIAADVPSWTASSAKLIPVSLSRSFNVSEAGQYKYYLNGRNVSHGPGNIKIWAASLNAVFYPK